MLRLAYCVFMHDIPKEAVVNMDQTGIHLVPKSSFTRARVGAKEIYLIGQDDKRQVTLVPPVAANGTMLPCQVIMKGQTERTLPLISSRNISGMEGWRWSLNKDNHWSNMETMKEWVENVLVHYCEDVRRRLGWPQTRSLFCYWTVGWSTSLWSFVHG